MKFSLLDSQSPRSPTSFKPLQTEVPLRKQALLNSHSSNYSHYSDMSGTDSATRAPPGDTTLSANYSAFALGDPTSGPDPFAEDPPAAISTGATPETVDYELTEPGRGETLPGSDEDSPPASEGGLPGSPPYAGVTATPYRPSSHDSEAAYQKVVQIQDAVMEELTDAWVEEDPKTLPFQAHLKALVEKEYPPGLDDRIKSLLEDPEYAGYKAGRWADIPANAPEETIYDPIQKRIDELMGHFGLDKESTADGKVIKQRRVVNTHAKNFSHNASDEHPDSNRPLKSEPDVTLFGTGPSATNGTDFTDPSYAQVASVWEIKTKPAFNVHERGQVGCYAREVFIQQPNRRFVYVALMTSDIIRILRFDRAGCYYSQPIDYHKDPVFFVKLVLLLGSLNEDLLGYDTTISWVDGQRVMKMTPTELFNKSTQRWEPNTEELVFQLADNPVFSRRTVRSRGTVCWTAIHKGQRYIIKDYWRADGRAYESAFLKKLSGVKGVGQMFAFADDRDSIQAGRGFGEDSKMMSDGSPSKRPSKHVLNRLFMRIVLVRYGDTLERARSASHLLCAVRDIVKGHRDSLMKRGILHRDISFLNLLLSPYDEFGVVIDWDLAKEMAELTKGQGTDGDSRTGTRAYQSVKVLLGSSRLGHHDNMDDLESIFYVLFHVLFGYDTSGNPLRYEALGQIAHWQLATEPIVLASHKQLYLAVGAQGQTITRYTGPERKTLEALIKDLRKFFEPRMRIINAALEDDEDHVDFPAYDPGDAAGHYDALVALIDKAIEKLPPMPTASESAPPSPNGSVGSNKRPRDDDPLDPATPCPLRKTLRRAANKVSSYDELSDGDDGEAGPSSPGYPSRGKKTVKQAKKVRNPPALKRRGSM